MAIFKCKICGGALDIDKEQSVTTCQYCGTRQTLPRLDDERRANLYDRANHFRRNNDFDKAMGIYESILNEDNTDADAYWSIVLCRYGIEYVEDAVTHRRLPTVNRAQYTSIFDDEDYKAAVHYADDYQREIYETEAAAINEIQKGFIALSQKEEPFDIFICYKETDKNGERTEDSVLATDLYTALTREGYKVFFSRITLEKKLGEAYEPYIFAALNSAKVMIVVGTCAEHLNAVWVKNEWSRFLALIKNGAQKTLIPAYKSMDPYDLPDEFSHLQAQDMSKLGFMQDMLYGMQKIIGASEAKQTAPAPDAALNLEPLFKRADMALQDGEFDQADSFYEQILNKDPENASAYLGKLLAELHLKSPRALANKTVPFSTNSNYKKAVQFADPTMREELIAASETVLNRRREKIYPQAKYLLERARDIPACLEAKRLFLTMPSYKDAPQCLAACEEKLAALQKEWDELRITQLIREKKQKRNLILTCIGSLLAILLVFLLSFVIIPKIQYNNALELIAAEEYSEAISLLEMAEKKAISKRTAEKIKAATADAKLKKERMDLAMDTKAMAAELQRSFDFGFTKEITNGNYEKSIRALLNAGVTVHITYECEGGTLNLPAADKQEGDYYIYHSPTDFVRVYSVQQLGYTFWGWSCEVTDYQSDPACIHITFTANWSEKKYGIAYTLDGGKSFNPITYTINTEAFTLSAPTKEGYTFIGWTSSEYPDPTLTVTIPKGSYGDLFFTAHWRINTYSLSFDLACDKTLPTATYTYGSTATLPTPQREGYTFAGWYNGEKQLTGTTLTISSDVTLVAHWEVITYSITYDYDWNTPDTNPNPTSYTVESDTIVLQPLQDRVFAFKGWYSDSNRTVEVTTIPKGSHGPIKLYAKWGYA